MDTLAEPFGRRRAARALGLSVLAWTAFAAAVWLVARSIGIELDPIDCVFVTAVLNLGVAIPSSPGFVGTYQWLAVAALGVLDVGTRAGAGVLATPARLVVRPHDDRRRDPGPVPARLGPPRPQVSTIVAVSELIVDGKRISDDGGAYVIAEIGHNHQGELEKAKALIHAAKECGVDAVKLQKRDNRRLYTRALYESPYDNEHSFGATYGEHREALELSEGDWLELREFSREEGVTLFATVFDEPSADFMAELGTPAFKIASADLLNTPLLRHVAALGKPIFLSTGGGTMEDVERAVETILPLNSQLCVMQCTASYPCAVEELNLGVIETYRARFPELVIGLSDHQSGIAMTLVGYMLGARVIEKHFTLDHAWKGSDHAFSLMPEGMRRLVRDLRRVPESIGDGSKHPLPSEKRPLEKMGKKLVAARDLPAGHVLAADDLVAKSPADGGLPPYQLDQLVGRRLLRALSFEQEVTLLDVEQVEEPVAARGARDA